jgi:sigma54-dependent transcription regulator
VALRLVAPTTRAVRRAGAGRGAALDLLQAALDLELRHRTADQIDRARFDLWARRAQLDLAAHDLANATGDVSTLEWIRDRIATGLDPVLLARVNGLILRLREHVNDGHVRPALRTVARIRDISGRMSH